VAWSPLSSPSAATGCSLQLLRDNTQRHARRVVHNTNFLALFDGHYTTLPFLVRVAT
jgi:hypothetical protein